MVDKLKDLGINNFNTFANMIEQFEKHIDRYHLCTKQDRILVAISGGVDSVVMLYLFVKAGFEVAAVHCNFMLRGEESEGDEKFVRNYCHTLNVKLFVKKCDAAMFTKKNKISIQESARELRYNYFNELLENGNYTKIAIAHNTDDDLETFFINFFRGSGVQGLKGISVKRGNIIRPLMFASREEIEQFAVNEGIKWREDSSNSSAKYLRNKIRHRLIPVINQLVKSKKGIVESLNFLKDDAYLFSILLENQRKQITVIDGNTIILNFSKLSNGISVEDLIFYLLKDYGFNKNDSINISNALKNQGYGKKFFSKEYRLLTEKEKILIRKRKVTENKEYFISRGDKIINEPFDAEIRILNREEITNFDLKDSTKAFFDMDKLKFPLKIRRWKKGDRFKPYGMKGTKLLSDFFTDFKLNKFLKEDIWLLVSGDDIIWIAGYRISDKVKITGETKIIFNISLKNIYLS